MEIADKKLLINGFPLDSSDNNLILMSKIINYDFDMAIKNLCNGGGTIVSDNAQLHRFGPITNELI
jgi:hypothetical protein